jgi:hypothetical protein
VLDVSNPAAPLKVGGLTTTSCDFGVALEGTYLYAMRVTGLGVFDVSSPAAPGYLTTHPYTGSAVTVSGTLALLGGTNDGLTALRVAPADAVAPHVTAARAVMPDPSRLRVRFTFDEDVSDSIAVGDLILTRIDDPLGTSHAPQTFAAHVASGTATATFAASLPAGVYEAKLFGIAVEDAWGNHVAADRTLRLIYVPSGQTFALPVGAAAPAQDLAIAGRLDIGTSSLVVDYDPPSPMGPWTGAAYGGINALLISGRLGGPGIFSSAAVGELKFPAAAEASDVLALTGTQTALFAGQTADATSVLVKLTWGGDANLDGKINIDDYGQIDFNSSLIGSPAWTPSWWNGDFNLDGKINIDDYGIIDFNVVAQDEIL